MLCKENTGEKMLLDTLSSQYRAHHVVSLASLVPEVP